MKGFLKQIILNEKNVDDKWVCIIRYVFISMIKYSLYLGLKWD